jgi:hypothetical protein
VLKADEGNEEADSDNSGELNHLRHRGDQHPAGAGRGEQHENHPGPEDQPEGGLPGHARPQTDVVGEKGVHPHAGRERDGVVGQQRHQQGGEGGAQAGRHDRPFERHPRLGEEHRIDGQDVGHGEEGRQSAEDLPARRRAGGADVEQTFEQGVHRWAVS